MINTWLCNGTIVNVNMNFWFLTIRISWHYWESNGRLANKCKQFFSLKCVLSFCLLAKIIWCLCVYCCNYKCEQATAGCCVTSTMRWWWPNIKCAILYVAIWRNSDTASTNLHHVQAMDYKIRQVLSFCPQGQSG
jgi:hypothetical protein